MLMGDFVEMFVLFEFVDGWMIEEFDVILEMLVEFDVLVEGVVEYKYWWVLSGFEKDVWIKVVEV